LKEKIDNLFIKPIEGEVTAAYKNKINGRKYILESNSMELKNLRISFENEEGFIEYENADGNIKVPFVLGEIKKLQLEVLKIPLLISAAWKSENILCFQINLIGELLGCVRVDIGFNDEFVTVSMKKYVEGILNNYDGIAVGRVEE
jgi:hypothetical protein